MGIGSSYYILESGHISPEPDVLESSIDSAASDLVTLLA